MLVVHRMARDDGSTSGEIHGELGGLIRELMQGLVNRHRLSACDDTLACGEVGILSGHDNLTCETFFEERLDRATGGAVVRGEDGIEVAPDFGDRGIDDLLGVFRFPVFRPIFVDDFDLAAGDKRREDVVLALFEEAGVVVGLGAVDANETKRRGVGGTIGEEAITQVFGLKLTDADVVECDVEIEIAVGDEAIVGEHGDVGLVGELHGFGHGGAVVWHDYNGIDMIADERFHVAKLADVIAVGGLHEDFRSQLASTGDEEVAVALPAFLFEGVHRESDDQCAAIRGGLGISRAAINREANEQRKN